MKYALLAYDPAGSLQELPAEDKRALHHGHAALQNDDSRATVIAHYRFRPARLVTTISLADGELAERNGPSSETSAGLRALYLIESRDPDAVNDLARQLPAIQQGGAVEIWPLAEPNADKQPTEPALTGGRSTNSGSATSDARLRPGNGSWGTIGQRSRS